MNPNVYDKPVMVQARDLSVTYHTRLGPVSAVDHINFDILRGEILGVVGESGCGKSTLGKALMRLIAPPAEISSGQIIFDGEDIMQYNTEQMRDFRGRRVSMIFQDPMTSLNPVQRIDEHLIEAIQVHERRTPTKEALERARLLVEKLGISERRMSDYPHQLSGGMRQRVMISLGLVLNADLIIADEATTSLDVIVEAKFLDLLQAIKKEFNLTIMAITHNIALVAEISDRIAVMYAGRIVEIGSVYDVFDDPKHPYTVGLLQSVPNIDINDEAKLYKMAGEPPNLGRPPSGCRFHPRCPRVMPICSQLDPPETILPNRQITYCWLYSSIPEGARVDQ